jgi:CRISPR-associated protein Cmr1
MQQVTFSLRTLTPLFLAGADPVQAELRPPAFRGLMRYWYRALLGGVLGADERTLSSIIEAEKELFGATDTGSAISLTLSDSSRKPLSYTKESYSRASTSGKDYLLWSMAETRRGKPDYRPDRMYFPADTQFQLMLTGRSENQAKLQNVIASLWLLTNLGGIGSRSRRCAGSLLVETLPESTQATSVLDLTALTFGMSRDVEGLQQQLQKGINYARDLVRTTHTTQAANRPVANASFDVLAPGTCSIYILREGTKPWASSDAAMRAIGSSLQDYRSSIEEMRNREIFGLPLGRNFNRRASPLLLRVSALQNGGYVGVAVIFKTGNPQRYSLIEEWITRFSGKVKVTF